ncbi:hypothetical protein B842_03335 [Corynebacterium humireducens NBRC 106098 = DSM 45392]|uniref:Uncharacterized protein n=1 Tax=Corynebacterium humireducens NBRC 106098 = DSM 45392 TaxID=1223515 RepID=A0A0B5D124_9CORY|nr:hypothetical protein [Corynebacterium humireducens]AJE32520.1 hypothetical protein B842_03335 [Corynebacterium humireducens NBRC 106098 = DSM 45392]
MIDWPLRDRVLRAVYELNHSFPSVSAIEAHLGEDAATREEIDAAVDWLAQQELVEGPTTWGGGLVRVSITPLGSNFVETGTSVEELARNAVQGAIINANTFNNHGPSINQVGNHNTATQHIAHEEDLTKVVEILRQHGEETKADELEQEAEINGALSAIRKAGGWIATNLIAAPVVAQIAPIVFSALGM